MAGFLERDEVAVSELQDGLRVARERAAATSLRLQRAAEIGRLLQVPRLSVDARRELGHELEALSP